MATQGEIRKRAVQAVRKCRQEYRKADTMGEKVERELDRLVKRKTLISPDSLETVAVLLDSYHQAADQAALSFRDLYVIIQGTVQI